MENNLDYPLRGDITKADVEKLQDRLLEIAEWIKSVLDKENIPYTVIFGTLLGAVRHTGWIPWDTDLDLAVPDHAYEAAVEALKKNCPENYIVHDTDVDPLYCSSWIRVVDKNSEVVSSAYPNENNYKFRGIHVDVYRLKKTTFSKYSDYILEENLRYFNMAKEVGLISEETYQTGVENSKKTYEENCKKYVGDTEIYAFLKYLITDAEIFPTVDMDFAGHVFKGPKDPHGVLKDSYYGSTYMTVPPYEKRDIKFDVINIW